jgi:hypothetical protein
MRLSLVGEEMTFGQPKTTAFGWSAKPVAETALQFELTSPSDSIDSCANVAGSGHEGFTQVVAATGGV